MSKITVLGGTGYTGGNIVEAAVARGHEVTSFSRNLPEAPIDGVSYVTGSLLNPAVRDLAVSGADVVIAALAPRGELESELRTVYGQLAELAAASGARFGVVGGFSSLRTAEGEARIAYGDGVPAQFATEARVMAEIVDDLQTSAPADLDWVFVSPAGNYGSYAPGEKTGEYIVGGEVANFERAELSLSGVDFAAAILDEIEAPKHPLAHISVTA